MKIKIFIASPSDVGEERDIVSDVVVPELRRIISNSPFLTNDSTLEIEAIRWETHAWPDVGADSQDVINKEISDFDILVGIMWKRFGTPTKRSTSGTGEEFQKAYDYFKKFNKPKIMFYFRTTPFFMRTTSEISQFNKVTKFRQKLEKLGVLYWEYENPLKFERNVREHLIRQISSINKPIESILLPSDKKIKTDLKPAIKASDKIISQPPIKIFMSYAHDDLFRVKNIYNNLKNVGLNPWIDFENLLPGQSWKTIIEEQLKQADIILIFFSKNTDSKSSYFNEELNSVVDKIKMQPIGYNPVIPIRLDQINPPEEFKTTQWIDYYNDHQINDLINSIVNRWESNKNVSDYFKKEYNKTKK
jgi:hypothetical protein